jgi:hypothetical protein
LRVPPGAERGIDVRPFRPNLEQIHSLAQEHWNMERPGLGTRDWGPSNFTLRVVLVHGLSIPTSNRSLPPKKTNDSQSGDPRIG